MPKFRIMQQLIDRLNLVSREILTGIPVIRAFSREAHEEARFDEANRDLMKTQLFTGRVMSLMMPMMMLIMNGVSVAIVWFGAKGVDLGTLAGGRHDRLHHLHDADHHGLHDADDDVHHAAPGQRGRGPDRRGALGLAPPSGILPDAREAAAGRGVVEFRNVSFRFPGADDDALKDVSFTARPGQVTAVIGATGSGKSTLVNLIPRFYDATGGQRVRGRRGREEPHPEVAPEDDRLRAAAGGAVQRHHRIQRQVLGRRDRRRRCGTPPASPRRRSSSLRSPEGFQSPIAQGGSNVSGGQKQRLSYRPGHRGQAPRPAV